MVLVVGVLLAVLSFSLQYCKCVFVCEARRILALPLYETMAIHIGNSRGFSMSGVNTTADGLYLLGVCVVVPLGIRSQLESIHHLNKAISLADVLYIT